MESIDALICEVAYLNEVLESVERLYFELDEVVTPDPRFADAIPPAFNEVIHSLRVARSHLSSLESVLNIAFLNAVEE